MLPVLLAGSLGAFLFLALAPGIPPDNYEAFTVTRIPYKGGLERNYKLEEGLQALPNKVIGGRFGPTLHGPESFAFRGDYVYTGVNGGDILRFNLRTGGAWEVAYGGLGRRRSQCRHLYEENRLCARPLGLEFDPHGRLVVADAVTGIHRIDLERGNSETIVPNYVKKMFFNSVAIARDGTIYYTVSSAEFRFSEAMILLFTAPGGFVVRHDERNKRSEILMGRLSIANGLALSEDEDYLVVNEAGRGRVWKYHLTGKYRGRREILLHLPAGPDNMRRSPAGRNRFLTGLLAAPPDPEEFEFFRDAVLPSVPLSRIMARTLYSGVKIPEALHSLLGFPFLEKLAYQTANLMTTAPKIPRYGLVVEFDGDTGRVTRSWHSPSGAVAFISEGAVHDGWMYLGSPWNRNVFRVPFSYYD